MSVIQRKHIITVELTYGCNEHGNSDSHKERQTKRKTRNISIQCHTLKRLQMEHAVNMQNRISCISNVMLESISAPFLHFFPPCFCTALLSVFTGMVISEDWRAGLGSSASTVRKPSGEREEVIFSASAPEGSLNKTREQIARICKQWCI